MEDYSLEDIVTHRNPSVGSIVKQALAVNPNLGAPQLIDIIRQSTAARDRTAGEFVGVETIDLERALALAKATLKSN